jgi:hypothetical protein
MRMAAAPRGRLEPALRVPAAHEHHSPMAAQEFPTKPRPVLSEAAMQDAEARFPELAAQAGRAAPRTSGHYSGWARS